jgi:hypothetical protein
MYAVKVFLSLNQFFLWTLNQNSLHILDLSFFLYCESAASRDNFISNNLLGSFVNFISWLPSSSFSWSNWCQLLWFFRCPNWPPSEATGIQLYTHIPTLFYISITDVGSAHCLPQPLDKFGTTCIELQSIAYADWCSSFFVIWGWIFRFFRYVGRKASLAGSE